jgi:arginase family enzyme
VRKLPVRASDVVELAPPLDQSDVTAFAALKAIYEAFAACLSREG